MPTCMPTLGASQAERADCASRDSRAWLACLPGAWREMVVEPLDFVEHREYEMAASRCFGHDVDGEVCYYAHGFALNETRSDDDEDFYQVVAYSEAVNAWRLRDERWLIHRVIHQCGEGAPGRGFYSFAEQCPR